MSDQSKIAYWTELEEVFRDGDTDVKFVVIRGIFQGERALGVYWNDGFPSTKEGWAPCRIYDSARDAMLAGLLHQAVVKKDAGQIKRVEEAIAYFTD